MAQTKPHWTRGGAFEKLRDLLPTQPATIGQRVALVSAISETLIWASGLGAVSHHFRSKRVKESISNTDGHRLGSSSALLMVCCAAIAFSSTGCVFLAVGGAAAGAGGVAYAKGNKKRIYVHSIDTVAEATRSAMVELDLNIADQAQDQLKGRIDAYTATGDRVRVDLKSLASNSTELSVRVNTFGSNSMSQRILQKIESYLPTTAHGGLADGPPDSDLAPAPPVQLTHPTRSERPVLPAGAADAPQPAD